MTQEAPAAPTVGEIARRLNASIHRVEYAIKAHGIEPESWAGNARVFSEAAVLRIAGILGVATAEPREALSQEVGHG